jgi:hypothetical protein
MHHTASMRHSRRLQVPSIRVRARASYAAIGWRRARHAASASPMGVEAEGADLIQAAEDEPVDRLRSQVTFFLRPAGEFGEAGPPDSSLVTIRRVDSSLTIPGT